MMVVFPSDSLLIFNGDLRLLWAHPIDVPTILGRCIPDAIPNMLENNDLI